MNANTEWLELVGELLGTGAVVAPRGRPCRELLAHRTCVDMTYPVVTVPTRRLGYRFLAAEAAWILSGDNRVATIAPYSKKIAEFSDDGVFFFGAYGPRFVDQVAYVVRALVEDPESRQAVMTIWRDYPPRTRDVPCTVALQWLIRNGRLHCVDTMRSSDAWLGWPYDVFNFSMSSAFIALLLRARGVTVELGQLTLVAGSQHLYEDDRAAVERCLEAVSERSYPYAPLRLAEFDDAAHLVEHLRALAELPGEPAADRAVVLRHLRSRWLVEAVDWGRP